MIKSTTSFPNLYQSLNKLFPKSFATVLVIFNSVFAFQCTNGSDACELLIVFRKSFFAKWHCGLCNAIVYLINII